MNTDGDDWTAISDHIREEQHKEKLAMRAMREQEFIEDGIEEALAGLAPVLAILAAPAIMVGVGMWWIFS